MNTHRTIERPARRSRTDLARDRNAIKVLEDEQVDFEFTIAWRNAQEAPSVPGLESQRRTTRDAMRRT